MQRDLQYLLDMLQSAELIASYTKHCSEAEFAEDIQLQDAVIRRILVIAEAARRVSDSTRQALTNIAWSELMACEIAWCMAMTTSISALFGTWYKLKFLL